MKFSDIPQYTQRANYSVHIPWRSLLDTIERWRNREKPPLSLNPDYQRAHVWTKRQQISYLEYILKGGNTGKDVLFNCPGWMTDWDGPFELVDGKQRINSVALFLKGKLPVFETYYDDFEDDILDIGCHFVFHVNNLPTREQVLRWYLEINTTGTPHSAAEIAKVEKLLEMEVNRKKRS